MKLVAYCGLSEVLVCAEDKEATMLVEWFKIGKRDITEYKRDETWDVFQIVTRAQVRT